MATERAMAFNYSIYRTKNQIPPVLFSDFSCGISDFFQFIEVKPAFRLYSKV
jgi:hypothetical protein